MEQVVDPARLRIGRLERLQAAMRAQGAEACLLFNDPNIRYATGASAMPIWSNTTFVRCALVPAEGRPILFDYPNAAHLFRGIEAHVDVRPMHAWEFYDDTAAHAAIFARETVAAMRELGSCGRTWPWSWSSIAARSAAATASSSATRCWSRPRA